MQGTTVIFNEEFIQTIQRRLEIAEQKAATENMPNEKRLAMEAVESLRKKLDWALDFTDIICTIHNVEVPSITAVKTLQGYELPIKHLQII